MDNFAEFAFAHYQQPGIEAACMRLQDDYGCDVVLVLFCAWLTVQGRQAEPAALQVASRSAGRVQNHLVRPLRAARRAVCKMSVATSACARLRQRELAAELLEISVLQASLPTFPVFEEEPARLEAVNVSSCAALFRLPPAALATLHPVFAADGRAMGARV